MPLSRKRKKRGRVVGRSDKKRRDRLANLQSDLTLQDLINVVAYQESQKPCKGSNTNVCVAEGCFNESCLDDIKNKEHEDDQ